MPPESVQDSVVIEVVRPAAIKFAGSSASCVPVGVGVGEGVGVGVGVEVIGSVTDVSVPVDSPPPQPDIARATALPRQILAAFLVRLLRIPIPP